MLSAPAKPLSYYSPIKIRYFNGNRRALRVGASPKNPTRRWRYKNKTIVLFFMDSSIIPRPVGRRISEINISRLRTGGHTASPLRILPCRRCRGRRGAAEPAPCGLRRDRQRANVGIGPYGRNGRKGFSPCGERERAARVGGALGGHFSSAGVSGWASALCVSGWASPLWAASLACSSSSRTR